MNIRCLARCAISFAERLHFFAGGQALSYYMLFPFAETGIPMITVASGSIRNLTSPNLLRNWREGVIHLVRARSLQV